MNDIYLILYKTLIFILSYIVVSNIFYKFLKKKKESINLWDVEIIVISVITATLVTLFFKYLL